jgi:beta-barrel assembly-enhancing protease
VQAAPDKLAAVNALAYALLARDRPAEALPVLDEAIARAMRAGEHSAFSDMDELNWTYDVRARTLYRLGRNDEAVAQMRQAASVPQHGLPNVRNAVDLGALLISLDRPREAVEALADIGKRWPNAELDYRWVLACAHIMLGDRASAEPHLRYVRNHHTDNEDAAMRAEVCTGDQDGIAAHLIRWLNDPATRSDALLEVQEFPDPKHIGPFDPRYRALWRSVAARDDVRAAIARVGRVGSYPPVDS